MTKPKVHSSAFIADSASIVGNVSIAADCSVYFNSTLRSDRTEIVIGARTNIQDNCLLHSTPVYPIHIGEGVSIGHGSIIHGCTINDNVLVGMGAIVMNNVEIGEGCIIGAGTLLPQNKKIPPNSVVMGAPGKVVREAGPEDIAKIKNNSKHYMEMSAEHKAGEHLVYKNSSKED